MARPESSSCDQLRSEPLPYVNEDFLSPWEGPMGFYHALWSVSRPLLAATTVRMVDSRGGQVERPSVGDATGCSHLLKV